MIRFCKGDRVVPFTMDLQWPDWNPEMKNWIGIEGSIIKVYLDKQVPYAHIRHDNGVNWSWPLACIEFSEEGGI